MAAKVVPASRDGMMLASAAIRPSACCTESMACCIFSEPTACVVWLSGNADKRIYYIQKAQSHIHPQFSLGPLDQAKSSEARPAGPRHDDMVVDLDVKGSAGLG